MLLLALVSCAHVDVTGSLPAGDLKGGDLDGEADEGFERGGAGWHAGGGYRVDLVREGDGTFARLTPGDAGGFGAIVHCEDAAPWRGREIALTGRLRTDLDGDAAWAGLWARVDGPDGKSRAFDNMQDRGPRRQTGWTAWRTYALAVPDDAARVCYGAVLAGAGHVDADDLVLASRPTSPWTAVPLDDAAIDRLEQIARLWATVRYFDPALARADVDWDGALVDAVRAAMAPGADVAAVARDMLAPLDGSAWLAPGAPPPPSVRTDASGALVVVPGDEPPSLRTGARVVLDLRGGVGLSDAWMAALSAGGRRPDVESLRWVGFPSAIELEQFYRLERPVVAGGKVRHAGPAVAALAIVVDATTRPTLAADVLALRDGPDRAVVGGRMTGADGEPWTVPVGGTVAYVASEAPVTAVEPDLLPGDDPIATALAWVAAPTALVKGSEPRRPPSPPPSDSDPATRVADVLVAWTTLGWFSPYWDLAHVDWDAAVRPAVVAAASAGDGMAFRDDFARFLSASRDGHSNLGIPGANPYAWRLWPAFAIAVVEGRVVVTDAEGSAAAAGLARGDVVVALDGEDALGALDRLAPTTSGSRIETQRRLATFRVLGGEGPIRLTVRHGDADVVLDVPRDSQRRVDAPRPKTGDRLDGDVLYVRVDDVTAADLEDLGGVAGVVVDGRGYPGLGAYDVFRRFAATPVWSQRFATPIRTGPGPEDVTLDWTGDWSVAPRGPRASVPIAFLSDASAQSQAELYLEMAREAHLGPIVGEPTAGVDGNVTTLTLPDLGTVTFTGLRCENRDGTPFHTVGVQPDVVVRPTIAGVAAGRDEQLEAAVAQIRAQQAATTAAQ